MDLTFSSPINESLVQLSDSEFQSLDLATVSTPLSPSLPTELKRLVFELAFDPDNPAINAKLLLVSKYVCSWLKPMIYRVFVQFNARPPYPNFQNIPKDVDLAGICQHARYLLVDQSRQNYGEALELLERCINLEDLLCWRDINLSHMWNAVAKLYAGFFAALPSLTHFGVLGGIHVDFQVLGKAVQACSRLRVLLCAIPFNAVENRPAVPPVYEKENKMVVFNTRLYTHDAWIAGTRGEQDVWGWAESIVFARQSGYFKSNEYQNKSISRGFPWEDHLTEKGLEWYNVNAPRLQIGVNEEQ
ncbi:hypothetical protein BJ165DRAFT_5677 [Panaeolus papilionaceus]|nr:hypothetical protein BJ165DRAFT_5677 [Panaeolus papilionaceus]